MTEDRIKDIDTIQDLLEDIEGFSQLEKKLPMLKAMGADITEIKEILKEADLNEMRREAQEAAELPDRFNDLLASEGWIFYDSMDFEVAKEAVKKAEEGNLDAAEQVLIDYYSPEVVERRRKTMYQVETFRPRMDLAEKAVEDYAEGRYHACIPVVLLLMDGLVQQIHIDVLGEEHSMSSEGADLTAWDSMAAHDQGLERFAELFRKSRKKTRTEEITVPYRHGILHGMDLGYDNEMVAAKCWSALFAVREWALKAEKGELTPPPEEPEPTLAEVLEKEQQIQEIKKKGEEWEPRDIVVERDVPATGEPDDFEEDTPERALVEFLYWWERDNYGYMAKEQRSLSGESVEPGLISDQFGRLELHSFELVEVEDVSPVFTDISVEICVSRFGEKSTEEKKVRMTRMGEDGKSAIPDIEEGTWVCTTRLELLT